VTFCGRPLPTVSVVVPTYAEPVHLRRLLASLSRQHYPTAQVEIVVVDDGSPEPVSEEVVRCAAPMRTTLLRHERNRGRAQARNTALAHATGDLVVFIDSDMSAAPDLLAAHAAAHLAGDRQAAIGDIRFAPEIAPTALTRYLDGRGVHRLPPAASVPFKCFVTGNSSLRRDVLAAAGGFDPGFRHYGGEDLELGYRLHLLGVRFHYAAEARTWHHHSRSLDATCGLMQTYGQHSLPRLVALHPELDGLLRLDFVRRPAGTRHRLLRLALLPPAYYLARIVGCRLERVWVPTLLLDYLLWASRSRGYLDSARQRTSA
jgi:glycosyltransferase involved in cell wall biosynthesis